MSQAASLRARLPRVRAIASRSRRGLVLLWVAAAASWCQVVAAQTPGQPAQAPGQASAVAKTSSSKALGFEVAYPSVLGTGPISARVYVLLGRGGSRLEPRFGPDWFHPQPFFARDVKDWKPTQTIRIDSAATGFPGPLDTLEAGEYAIQAVVRVNRDTHDIGTGEGNAYGPVVHARLDPGAPRTIPLAVDKLVPPRKFHETERIKLAELESPLLSAFYHRPIKQRAAVILPETKSAGKLPTVYIIPGFGGDHHMASRLVASTRMNFAGDMVPRGARPGLPHGPPRLCRLRQQRPLARPLTRSSFRTWRRPFPWWPTRGPLLNGHSSGGWSSLWLQVTYADFFGGTWSTAPDPVDFRDFQRINIYTLGNNMFFDREEQTPAARPRGQQVLLHYHRFPKMEDVMGRGGQLGSFEAVFSPRGRISPASSGTGPPAPSTRRWPRPGKATTSA